MAKNHMSTYVSVPKEDGEAGLLKLAEERLGGSDGVKCVSKHLVDNKLCGTFTRDWDEPDRVTHTDEPLEGSKE
jgi:hypothetical protein